MKIYSLHKMKHRLLAMLLAVATLGLGGCIEDADMCPPEGDEADGLHLRFDIVTRGGVNARGVQSRALVEPPATQTQKGSIAENYLDIPRLTFLIFDNEKKLLAPFYPQVNPEAETDYVRYEVNAVIKDIYFDFKAEPDPDRQVPFYILVLANYSGYSPLGLKMARGMTLEEFFGENSMTFATPEASPWWYPHPEDIAGGVPHPGTPQFIPMAGLQRFAPTVAQMMSGEEGDPYWLDNDINMLRAMAKIEVVDHIDIIDGTTARPADSPSIDKVELMGFYSRGTMLPKLGQWNLGGLETQYVSAANVPASAVYNEPYIFGQQDGVHGNSFRDFGLDEAATAARTDGCKVYSVYVPEYTEPAAGNKAWIQVTVANPTGSTIIGGFPGETDRSVLYQLRLAEYPLPTDTDGNIAENEVVYIPLLRNNIYRYEIMSLATNVVNLVWTVCPMDDATVTIPPFN